MNHALTNAELDALALKTDARQGEAAMQAVYDFLGRFVAYPSEASRVAHALWIMHTHLMDEWEATPRLAFLSAEPGSGKTRALEITELLVPNPVQAVNVSPAYLFRKVGGEQMPTILFDEIDTVFGPKAKENEEIRGLLNAGHRRGAVAGRCVIRGKTVETEEIAAYCAVALAGLGWLPETLLSRSIIIRMRRRHAGEKVEAYRRRMHAPEGDRVREQIELWARALSEEIVWPELPPEIQDRDADVWEPLIALADAIGGAWPKRARVSAVSLVSLAREVEQSLGIRLLTDLRQIYGEQRAMASKMILDSLSVLEESPWADLRGKPLTERKLARLLKEYGVQPKTIRIGDGTVTARGYTRADLLDAWVRYLPPAPSSDTSNTSNTKDGEVLAEPELPLAPGEPDPDGWSFNVEG